MNLGLAGKRAVVLGASRGLGAAIAKSLATEGASVIAAARSAETTEGWRSQLPAEVAARVHPVATDLTERTQVEALAKLAAQHGPTHILINNSGGPPPGTALETTIEQWLKQFEVMAAHLFHFTSLLLPGMLQQRWGRIITITSFGVEQPVPNLALSNGVRAAIVGWSKTLATEVAARGVTVNIAMPGRIHTDRLDQLDQAAATREGKSKQEISAAMAAGVPIGRYGRPEEFADVVTFLASERASYITGARIRIDGGLIRSV
jgi:3-oxoacyl-[acyl-carrier protein] reductase